LETNLSRPESVFAIDCVILGFDEGELKALLVKRNEEPFKGSWALPGCLVVDRYGSIDDAAVRVLHDLTGLNGVYMEQFYTYADVDRHTNGRVVSVAYYAVVRLGSTRESQLIASYTRHAAWVSVKEMSGLAFDHMMILDKVLKKMRRKVLYHPIAFELLPEKFTLTQLQNLYEVILNKKLDKRNFRKKISTYQVLIDLNEKQKDVSYRAAKLFKFDKKKYTKMAESETLISVALSEGEGVM
jgi:8-oxo-dGTP diphosphatase